MRFGPRYSFLSVTALSLALAAACGRTTSDEPPSSQATGGDSSSHPDDGGGGSGGAIGMGGVPEQSAGPQFDCREPASQQFDARHMAPYSVTPEIEQQVEEAFALMKPVDKFRQMTGVDESPDYWSGIQASHDVQLSSGESIRGYRYRDAGRGVNLDAWQDNRPDDGKSFSTAFPATSLRAASWDLDLEKRVGAAIGEETAASLNNALMAPCMNVIRHPFWGRTQETYGEDSYHIGRMATAMAVGIQEYVVGCAKHFLGNNVEKSRSLQNAVMSEQTLREIYARHFEMVVKDAGIGCVMAAYNSVNGQKSTQNRHVIRDFLKAPVDEGGMGFQGFVITDWWAMPGENEAPDPATAQAQTIEALEAGTDIEVPYTHHYHASTLSNADPALVDEAARRVLTQKFRFKTAWRSDDWGRSPSESALQEGSLAPNAEHEALAEEAALKSMVLLENGLQPDQPVLPLQRTTKIAVVGPQQRFSLVSSDVPKSCLLEQDDVPQAGSLNERECTFRFATDPALGDRASSRVNADPERSIGPFQGIQSAAGEGSNVTSGASASEAEAADAVVVVVGYTPGDEGEEYPIAHGGDRSSLDLPPGHNELVQSVLDLGKPTIIVIESGSIVNMPWLSHVNKDQATIWASYPGMRGGAALGRLIFGDANFSGKMPLAWPVEAELPPFKDSELETTMGYFFGYREFDRREHIAGQSVEMIYPFGHGKSYSSFDYSNLTVPCETVTKEAIFNVTVDITNTSSVDGDEVVMLFVKPPAKPEGIQGERPWKELKSFARVSVPAGQTVTAELPLRVSDLRRWEGEKDGKWVIDSGEYTLLASKNAADAETTSNRGTVVVDGD